MKAGELTEKEAEAMMEGLKKRADMYRKGEDKEYDAFIARIRVAVAEGKMTREQAAGRIEAYKKSIGGGMRNNRPLRPHRSVMQ